MIKFYKVFLIILILNVNYSKGQIKKPIIMILPSDNWCEQRYFMGLFDNQGSKQKVPNYKQAFQEDTELGQVISKIGSIMVDFGFPLKDAEQEIKSIEIKSAEDNISFSNTSGSILSESSYDKLKKRAKADIIIQIWWKVTKTDNGRVLSLVLEAFDAYTNKRIASASGNSAPNKLDILPIMLEKAIYNSINQFASQIQYHFDDILTNGREVVISVKRWENWEKNLETEILGKELIDHITEWMQKNTFNSNFNLVEATENIIQFEQVRIPLFDENKNGLDTRQFAKKLQKYLNSTPFDIQVKLMTRGLGEVILVLGEK